MVNNFEQEFSSRFEPYNIPLHGVRLPTFIIDPEKKGNLQLSESATNFEFLEKLCLNGLNKITCTNPKDKEAYSKRIKYELGIIKELGFVDYILLVWDIINHCHENDIPVGLGRGSAAGSLVLFTIGVTGLDPIKYDLFFERFISKIRAKSQIVDGVMYLDGSLMCDIDMDICYYKRPEVIKWLENRFQGQICKIITLNSLSGKLLIKECGKVVGNYSEEQVKIIANMIPKLHGVVEDIEIVCYGEEYPTEEQDTKGKWKHEPVAEFKEWCDNNPRIFKTALKLRNLIKNKSVHASAMLLSYSKIEDSCPTELTSKKEVVSSFDMNCSALLNVKLDLLGLRSVSVVDDVCKAVNIRMKDINLNDPFIYRQLQELKTPHGLFQVEADTVYKACKKIQPKNLEELSGVIAVARPGAMQFIDQYASYTTTGTVQSIHPFFDDVLGSTGGLALYQEQLMKMANKIGFSLDEAELIRKVVGKKQLEKVKEWKEKIYAKVQEKGLPQEVADILWRILDDSANYSFNKSHSIAYAALAAATVYLKFKYPQQFYLSLLKMTKHEPSPIEEISKIHKELIVFNIELLPPHILKSQLDFSFEGENIRYGLLSIKGISDKSIERLAAFRHEYSNKFEIFQGANEANLPIGVVCSLIQAGALEGFQQSRSKVVLEAQIWKLLKTHEKACAMKLGPKYGFDLVKVLKAMLVLLDEDGKPYIKASRFETIKRNYAPYLEIFQTNKASEELANWFYERALLGYNYYVSLKEIYQKYETAELSYIASLPEIEKDEEVAIVGTVKETHTGNSKKGNKYFRAIVTDETGDITCMLVNTQDFKTKKIVDRIENCRAKRGRLPKEGDLVVVKGKKGDDAIFCFGISIQDQKIYTKLSELESRKAKKEGKSVDKINETK